MADTAVLLNIGEMIDLAIGTPEVGVVDFNMLQTILHCLAQQLRILGKNVELRGSVAALPVNRDNMQTIDIREFSIDTEEKVPTKKAELPPPKALAEPDTILVVERIKRSESPPGRSPLRSSSPVIHAQAAKTAPKAATPAAHVQPKRITSTEKLSLVTLSKFNLLEKTVEDIKDRVYGSMPKNEEILEEVRSQTNVKAIQEMWTSLNVSSRLEAAEAGIAKLSSLVQDLIAETTELQDALKRRASKTQLALPPPSAAPAAVPAAAPAAVHAAAQAAAPTAAATTGPTAIPSATATAAPTVAPSGAPLSASPAAAHITLPPISKEDLSGIQEHLARLRYDLDALTSTFYAAMDEMQTGETPSAPPPPTEKPSSLAPPARERRETFSVAGGSLAGLSSKVQDLERRLKECCDSIGKKDGLIQDQINSFQDQLEHLLKQVAGMGGELTSGKLSPDLIKDLQGLMQLFQTVQDMQEQLKQVHDTALQLAAEKEDRQYNMNALLEQIELLKTIKLDREDMVEAMAEKADLRMLARKVSHDQFELACEDLSRGLEHALGKLNIQEALWQQALDDIQREIESKLDKMELSPVKEFFNNKLKQLQESLKQMASLRKEVEAAGTKRKLLRDVNCISCDANAVMPMEAGSSMPMSKPMPANLSMKPYLSYELDTIRKTQQSNLPARNMHDWENIDKQMSQPKAPQKVRSDTGKHLCNRYCGGSHTMTTPAQRVARLGHFIKQWGPDVLPLSSGLAAGDDGRMYHVNATEAVNVGPGAVDTCTPKSPKKYDSPKSPPRSMTISAECRCLEGRDQRSHGKN